MSTPTWSRFTLRTGRNPGQLPQLDPAEQPEVGLDDEEDDRGTDTHGAGA